MNIERIDDLIFRARAEAAAKTEAQPGSERDRLLRVAQEFESMLMLQMLKEMRKAGSWDNEEEGKSGYGAETMLDTIDVELAGHLARAQGLGLGRQMLDALQRMEGGGSTAQDSRPVPDGGSIKQDPPDESPSAPVGRVLNFGPGDVTSGYGWRQDPIHGAARFHRGVDIRAAYGQDVPSAASGRVVSAGTEGGYGQTVVIEHAGGVRTRYAHLSMTMVAAGDEVGEGQVVGRAGRSGRATGTHLHFEVTNAAGDALNPEHFSKLKAAGAVADFSRASNSVLQETRR
ncbi:MAG TPA: peptidoglycan DD-metalloendopeptidase family protein [Vicinamibacterales bacterium]|nr:peptidoglycan DD-metalloendopeptidase family protein [Vicinamibacterales bacterium]